MLVLSRKRGELVKIGHNIWVKILQTGQSSTKIGFVAPQHVSIERDQPIEVEMEESPFCMNFKGEIG